MANMVLYMVMASEVVQISVHHLYIGHGHMGISCRIGDCEDDCDDYDDDGDD